MLVVWFSIGARIKKMPETQRSIRLLHKFFLSLLVFFFLMSFPYFYLITSPEGFPAAAAWGYVVGHIFLYLGFLYVARMVCSLVPRLNKVEKPLVVVWSIGIAVITLINAKTMIFGTQPFFDYTNNITQFRAALVVGATIGMSASIALLPAIVLFVRNVLKSSGAARVRSALLAAGFLMIMTGGPLHDVARAATAYVIADVVSILGLVVIGLGVLYRFEQNLAPVPQPVRPVMAAPSNTV
jgi:hypothetical protein